MFLVQDIMNESVRLAVGSHTVAMAAEEMMKFNIGMLVVVAEGKLAGMITERDIVRRVILEGLDPSQTTIESVMNESPLTISPSASISDACQVMIDEKIRYLPVVSRKQEPVGIVGMTDLLRFFGNQAEISDLYEA